MKKFNLEKKDYVFIAAPVVEDVAIEFGVDDPETITCMYEVFKRVTGLERQYPQDDENYQEGYKDGYNEAIEEVGSRFDDLSWEIGKLKKN